MKSKQPTHTIYEIIQSNGKVVSWNAIGTAFAHKGQGGLTLVFDEIPADGRCIIRPRKYGRRPRPAFKR